MSRTRVIGHEPCPRCLEQLEVREIEAWPFPDERESWNRLVCDCGFQYERDFNSDSQASVHDWVVKFQIEKEQVAMAIGVLEELLPSRPTEDEIRHRLPPPHLFPALYVAIAKKAADAQQTYDQSVHEFCTAGTLEPALGEFFDNEVRALVDHSVDWERIRLLMNGLDRPK